MRKMLLDHIFILQSIWNEHILLLTWENYIQGHFILCPPQTEQQHLSSISVVLFMTPL